MFSLSFRYRNDTVLQSHGGIKGTAHIISRMIHMHIGIKLHTWVSHRAVSTHKGPMWRPCVELSSFLKMQRDSFHLTSVLTASLVSARWAPSVARKKKACFFLLILRHLHEEKKNQVLEELISLCLSLSLCFGAAAPALQPPTPCAPHVSLYLDWLLLPQEARVGGKQPYRITLADTAPTRDPIVSWSKL